MAKKIWERMQEDAEANKLENERIRQEANQNFQQERERENEIRNRTIQSLQLPIMKTFNNMLDNAGITPEERNQVYINAKQMAKEKVNNTINTAINEFRKPLWEQVLDTANIRRNTIQNTALQGLNEIKNRETTTTNKNSFWGQMQALVDKDNYLKINKEPVNINTNSRTSTILNPISNNINIQVSNNTDNETEKNKNVLEDAGSLAKLTALGTSTGVKNIENAIETSTEQRFPVLKKLREMQYQASQKVDEREKAEAKLNQFRDDKIETNLVKKAIRENIEKDEEEIAKEQSKLSNPVTQSLGEIAPSMGQMLPGTVLSSVNPLLGTEYFYASSKGSYINDALKRGMTEEQADRYGTIMAVLESGSESVITGQQLSKISKAFQGKEISKGLLNSYKFNILENAVQEAVMEPAQELTAGLVGGKADWTNIGERTFHAGFNGGLMGVISNGATKGLETTGKAYSKGLELTEKAYSKIKNGEKLTANEIINVLKENIKDRGEQQVANEIKEGASKVYQEVNNAISKKQPTTIQNEQINLTTQQINNQTQENALNQNVIANNQLPVQENNQKGKSFEDIVDEAMSNYESNEVPSPLQSRDIKTIGKETKVNAYQYDNPEVKPYFQEMAQILGEDIGNIASSDNRKTTKGGGTALSTNIPAIKQLKEMGYSYNQIIDGIVDIIDDHGQENNALSKKIEIILDDQLRNGYTNSYGQYIRPNEEYINLISKNQTNQELPTDQENLPVQEQNVSTNNQLPVQNYQYEKTGNTKIDLMNEQASKYLDNSEKTPTRHDVIQNNRELARENIKNISTWKDKKSGLKYQLETMERNMYDIIPDKAEAQKMNDTYFEPIHKSEAEKQKFINQYNDKIKELNLNKYESEAVQYLGEQKYNPDFKTGDLETTTNREQVGARIKENIKKGRINEQKVNKAIETFRSIYDELFEIENKTLRENGYKEKPYRKGYFPHFVDYVPETRTERVLNKLGFKVDKRPLPTDISGITEQFVPGKTWNRSALERKGNKTDYNALKGFDTYIAQASDNIFHTENIQKLRGLENEIRYQYSDKGIQTRIDQILNDESLYQEEKQALIDDIFKQVENPMPNLVTELRRYSNALANKKSEADRSIENMIGRPVYSTVNAIENRFGANAVGLNVGSAVTNFIPITQAWSQIGTKNMGRAVIDTIKSYIKDDGFSDKSTFLTNRINQADKLYKTSLEKISDKTSFLFNAIDEVTSNIVVRGKYLENIQNGMNEQEAMKNADRFGANVIADRSKGALPTKFEEKNPITKMFSQFQLEVNNQYRYMFKDLPRDLKEKGLASIALAFLKMFFGAWIYNEASEKVTGRRPAFDPLDIAVSSYKTITDKDMSTYNKISNIAKDIGQELPFVSGLVGGGRVPVNGAIPDIGNLTKAGVGLATGEMNSNKATETIGKELSKPLYYLLPPFGGGQLKKSVEGIQTVQNGGSYGIDSKGREILQFPVENPNVGDYIKAGIFGKYALPEAKTYTDSGYKSLNAKQTKTYKESKIPYKEYMEYLDKKLKKNEEKINYISNQKWGENQKWGIYTNEIFSDEKRKDGGSQLEDAKYAISNGTTKKEYMDLYNKTSKRNMDMPTKDEGKKLKEEGISLKNYIDYEIKVHDETKKKKENKELKENGQLKNKDKIQILLDSNYSDAERQAIYKNHIKSKDPDGKIDIFTALMKNGMNINQYLKYAQQDFESDKIDDGTVSGKAVSSNKQGSKENKLFTYVNENISGYTNRLLILGNQYKLSANERTKIEETIHNLDLSTKEKLELLQKMQGFTVYKNGNVKW